MACHIVWNPRILWFKLRGFISKQAYVDGVRRATADPGFERLHYIVNDFLEIDGHDMDQGNVFEELTVITLGAAVTNPNVRIVAITKDASLTNLAQRLGALPQAKALEIAAFPTVAAAERWMRAQPPKLRTPDRFLGRL